MVNLSQNSKYERTPACTYGGLMEQHLVTGMNKQSVKNWAGHAGMGSGDLLYSGPVA